MAKRDKQVRDYNRYSTGSTRRYHRENPSFSSSLLDSIYNSIDHEPKQVKREPEESIFYRDSSMRKKQQSHGFKDGQEGIANFQITESKKISSYEKVSRRSMADFGSRSYPGNPVLSSSSSSSSQSSCDGGFSSSESEFMQKPKPIRTSSRSPWRTRNHENRPENDYAARTEKAVINHEDNFVKTKSKALKKLYRDLKRVKKQPLSPGGRLASFLNSLFTPGNGKKTKASSEEGHNYYEERKNKLLTEKESYSTCSSASSYSRSCLSKTPSSRGSTGGVKRSVRFCPVSVILDENSRPCGHKSLSSHEENNLMTITTKTSSNSDHPINDKELKFLVMNENSKIEEVARNYFLRKKYLNKNIHHSNESSDEDKDDDDDTASYASSDLFELGNLSPIGIDQRYNQDLPVYETTHLDTNLAIANGILM